MKTAVFRVEGCLCSRAIETEISPFQVLVGLWTDLKVQSCLMSVILAQKMGSFPKDVFSQGTSVKRVKSTFCRKKMSAAMDRAYLLKLDVGTG